ncbi:MAG: bifunctional glutamate N-acetyltransferase/amino-acid acetyltransferase ArgJ [Rothia sp. (in: high G+C Gram-positive bacteria)]|nr:bifunctional glutamate N-acetyltransferase/amino-acid acetyltransferase ArgJ [Rothia sp. (in: high G+C Gram-positive bacteria)]
MSNSQEEQAKTGVTFAAGFRAGAAAAGISSQAGKKDLALVVNDGPDKIAAAVFTSNRFAAAPVLWSRAALADGQAQAIVLNSGGANACTGQQGMDDSQASAQHLAAQLGLAAQDVLVCSTGIIGQFLPMPKLIEGIDRALATLAASGQQGRAAAEAIMTTDTVSKEGHRLGQGAAGQFRLGGMAKGAGMLAPAMATMLAVITTDAVLADSALAQAALEKAVAASFNQLDSDGCMSTNDTVILLASGASGVQVNESELLACLTPLCQELALALIADAEGAKHDIYIHTVGAATQEQASQVSRAVARSNLFKCAIFGNDPNWGRILAEVGTTSAEFETDRVNVSINGVQVCRAGGIGQDPSLVDLASTRKVTVEIDLAAGDASACIMSNDLTYDYVHENSAYTS